MHIESEAIIIKAFKFQESSLIVDCFTENHGIVRGLIKSKRKIAEIMPISLVYIIHKARLPEQLGYLQIETIRNYLSLLGFSRVKLKIVNCILAILVKILHEGDKHPLLYNELKKFLEVLQNSNSDLDSLKSYALLELRVLAETGYGLDLTKCVVSKTKENLIYISPKSGCAVSAKEGEQYSDKLLKMPEFYLDHTIAGNKNSVRLALEVSQLFLQRCIFEASNSPMPYERMTLTQEIDGMVESL